MQDSIFMRRCLALGERGRGHVGNGALVGAVLVRDGAILAEGWHEGFGKLHAERQLLQNYEQKISSNDTLYVNLEPCVAHRTKKNPACVDVILERGIKRVVCGMRDPDPRVAGKGIALLRSKGVEVIEECLPEECMRLNRGYCSVRTKDRPWITLHNARMIDGRIANPDGSPSKITFEKQDRWTHEYLRAKHDAILVGIGTIASDNPNLNTRFVHNPPHLYRIILDPQLKISSEAKVINPPLADATILIVAPETEKKSQSRINELRSRGVRVWPIDYDKGEFNFSALFQVLLTPKSDFNGITSILVEGGPKTWESFRKAKVIDEEVTLVGM